MVVIEYLSEEQSTSRDTLEAVRGVGLIFQQTSSKSHEQYYKILPSLQPKGQDKSQKRLRSRLAFKEKD